MLTIGIRLMVELQNKGRFRRKLWILHSCAIALILITTLWREREPRYEDHSLLEWIAIADHGDKNSEYSERDALEAVRHIGTNAIPFLIKCIGYRERPWQTRLGSLCYKLPEKIANPLSHLVEGNGAQRQLTAFSGLYILGSDARTALPALTNLLTQPSLVDYCMPVLIQIGGDGLTAVLNVVTNQASPFRRAAIGSLVGLDTNRPLDQVIVSTLTNSLADTNRELAFYAAQILCRHHSEKELAMKTLVDALQITDKKLRSSAISHLRISLRLGYSVPALLQFLQDTNSPLSPYSAGVLGESAHDGAQLPALVLPALTNSLHDPRPLVRSYAVSAICNFGRAAESAAPALLDLWDDPDQSVRQFATNAFFEVTRYYALETFSQLPTGMSREQVEMYERRYGIRPFPSTGLTNLLDHPDPRIRAMATNAFRKLGATP
jgi:HEAT repeat protein